MLTGPKVISGRRVLVQVKLIDITAADVRGIIAGVLDFSRPASGVVYPLILGI